MFLLTDIEGSTPLWDAEPEAMFRALLLHDEIASKVVAQYNGRNVKSRGEGDSLFLVFDDPIGALHAAIDFQEAIQRQDWPTSRPLRVRCSLDIGEAVDMGSDYYGPVINRCARIRGLAPGSAILASADFNGACGLIPAAKFVDLGRVTLRGLHQAETVFQVVPSGSLAPKVTISAFRTNLPEPNTTFLGRERELADIADLLTTHRYVTLHGPGGIGKSRLALESAKRAISLADAIWVIDLANCSSEDEFVSQIASVLDLRDHPGTVTSDIVKTAFCGQKSLLIFENCELALEDIGLTIGNLLADCPEVRALCCSRRPMRYPQEILYRVPPFSTTSPGNDDVESDAVAFFATRVRALHPELPLNRGFFASAREITLGLDGYPLALELAAAQLGRLPIDAVAAEWAVVRAPRPFAGQEASSVDTVLSVLASSLDLLEPAILSVAQAAAVFRGSFSAEMLEHVADAGTLALVNPTACLLQLVEQSLLQFAGDSPGHDLRFQMLHVVRQGVLAQMSPEMKASHDGKHRAYFVEMASAWGLQLQGRDQAAALALMEASYPDLRSIMTGPGELATLADKERIAAKLGRYFLLRGLLSEGRNVLSGVQRELESHGSSVTPELLLSLGSLCWRQGDFRGAQGLYEEALAAANGSNDILSESAALNNLGLIDLEQARYEDASARLTKCLCLRREVGRPEDVATTLNNLGLLEWNLGRYSEAREYFEECLQIRKQLGDDNGAAATNCNLALLLSAWGEPKYAVILASESARLYRQLGDRGGLAFVLHNLGSIQIDLSDLDNARSSLEQSIEAADQIGNASLTACSQLRLADIDVLQDRPDTAVIAYRRAKEALLESNDQIRQLEADYGLVLALMKLDALKEAQYQLRQADRRARALGFDDSLFSRYSIGEARERLHSL